MCRHLEQLGFFNDYLFLSRKVSINFWFLLFIFSRDSELYSLPIVSNQWPNYMYKYKRKKELIFKSIASSFIMDAKLCDL